MINLLYVHAILHNFRSQNNGWPQAIFSHIHIGQTNYNLVTETTFPMRKAIAASIQYLNVSIIKCVKTKLLINFFIVCNYTFTERPKLGLADGMYTTQHYFYCLEQDCQGKLSEIGAKKNLRIMYHTVNKISLFSVV